MVKQYRNKKRTQKQLNALLRLVISHALQAYTGEKMFPVRYFGIDILIIRHMPHSGQPLFYGNAEW